MHNELKKMVSKDESSYGHVLKYVGIFGGVQGLSILVGLVRNKVLAYFLGPDGMGLVSLFNSTINFISQSTNLGISFSAVRHVSGLFDEGNEAKMQHFVKVVQGLFAIFNKWYRGCTWSRKDYPEDPLWLPWNREISQDQG